MKNNNAHTEEGQDGYVTSETARTMMLIGFDEPCSAKWMLDIRGDTVPHFRYNYPSEGRVFRHNSRDTKGLNGNGGEPFLWSAPTYAQAMDWFREEFAVDGVVAPEDKSDGCLKMRVYRVTVYSNGNGVVRVTKSIERYARRENAVNACVKLCLEMVQTMPRKHYVKNVK